MNCVEKIGKGQSQDGQDKDTVFNHSQRLMVNQFIGFYSALIKSEFECPFGTELLVNTM